MKETICMTLAIFAALGVVMLFGALIESGVSSASLLGLAGCVLATRGFYLLGTQPTGRRTHRHCRPSLQLVKKNDSLRAA